MNSLQILELIKNKRNRTYCDYEFNLLLNMREENTFSFEARKKTINNLQVRIRTYDDLISTIENGI